MEKNSLIGPLRERLLKLPRPAVYAAALAVTLTILFIIAFLLRLGTARPPGQVDLPAFDQPETSDMKAAFFEFLRPVVRYHNGRIAEQREWLFEIAEKESLGWFDERRLQGLAEQYRLDLEALGTREAIAALKRRVDVVPESLVLIQAAKESGWGRSRFSREGNMLFGERCFDAGCGMVPEARPSGATFEVASFATAHDAVGSYLRNLNTHPSYVDFRRARQKLRESDEALSGVVLARYLGGFSERGDVYIEEIVAMILENELEEIDDVRQNFR
jgi:Bax protein